MAATHAITQQKQGSSAVIGPPYTPLESCQLKHSTFQVLAEYLHTQPDYVDAILANFAPEKTPEHPRAACAINSQISASLWLDQSALSAMYDMNNLPTHPKQLHIPTCMDCCFKEAFANRTHIVFNNSSLS